MHVVTLFAAAAAVAAAPSGPTAQEITLSTIPTHVYKVPDSLDTKEKGECWYFDTDSARCGLRYTHQPQDKGFSLGFRVAADLVR